MFLLGPNPPVWECGWLLGADALDLMVKGLVLLIRRWCYVDCGVDIEVVD